jgi:hypothetical protein
MHWKHGQRSREVIERSRERMRELRRLELLARMVGLIR